MAGGADQAASAISDDGGAMEQEDEDKLLKEVNAEIEAAAERLSRDTSAGPRGRCLITLMLSFLPILRRRSGRYWAVFRPTYPKRRRETCLKQHWFKPSISHSRAPWPKMSASSF